MEQDRELLKRCLGGNNAAWETLLKSHSRKIYNLCYRFTGRAVEGEMKGYALGWLDSTQVKWFAWAAEHPETTIYGK